MQNISSFNDQEHRYQVIGYITQYDAWKNIPGLVPQGGYNQINVDFTKYTILNFAFFGVAKDGSLHSGDWRNKQIHLRGEVQEPAEMTREDVSSSWDKYILYGQLNTRWNEIKQITEGTPKGTEDGLLDLCKANGVKCLASIGGWSMSKHFPEVARDDAKRARLVNDCRKLITMGFDGIDIDWEYPGKEGMNIEAYSSSDFFYFAKLMEDIRNAIGPEKLLTAAFSAVPANLVSFDWSKLNAVMSYYNMMTYDMHGGWSAVAGHNAPLYGYHGGDKDPITDKVLSLDTLSRWMKSQPGIDIRKINLGAPFYGRGVITQGAAALNATTIKREANVEPDGRIMTSADLNNWKDFGGAPYYSLIQLKTEDWKEEWDDVAKVPYKIKGNYFLSYDNVESIKQKAEYVRNEGLGGLIIWTVFGDMENMAEHARILGGENGKLVRCPNTTTPLLDAIDTVFRGLQPTIPQQIAPIIWLDPPYSGATFEQGKEVEMKAHINAPEYQIESVAFYIDDQLVARKASPPYTHSWVTQAAKEYKLKAAANLKKWNA